jgi:CBS domain-containing protein
MQTVKQLLDEKGHDVVSIHPDASVLDAIQKMADKEIGALLVVDNDKPVGIMTERLYARGVILKGKSSPRTKVREIMTRSVICARPEQTVEECMAVMTEKRVRHLPVLDHKQIVGIVSIGDLVKSIIADQKFVIEQFEHYVHG